MRPATILSSNVYMKLVPTGLVEYTDFTTSGTWISRPAISFTGFSVRDALSV